MGISPKIITFVVTAVLSCHSAQSGGLRRLPAVCRPLRQTQKLFELKGRGSGPLGPFNKNYMALTYAAAKAFPNLVQIDRATPDHVKGNLSRPSSPHGNKRSFPQTTMGPCVSKGRSCAECSATTDLGPGIIPRYINEIVCESQGSLCHSGRGFCKPSAVLQTFLRKTGRCGSNGHQTLETFTQKIRTCCQCILLPFA